MGNDIEPNPSTDLTPGTSSTAPEVVQGGQTVPSGTDKLEFDQLSAAIRADASDTDSFFRVLVSKLADALGDRVQIKREGGLFKRDRPVVGITIDLSTGAGVVLAAMRKGGGIECTISRPVRGIVVSSKPVTLPEWLDALARALAAEAQQSEQTWAALHGLLA